MKKRRCVFCKSTRLKRGLMLPWRWFCWSCDRIQPEFQEGNIMIHLPARPHHVMNTAPCPKPSPSVS